MPHVSSMIHSAYEWPIPWPHYPQASVPSIVPSVGLRIPFPGATGNVAREDVLYALRDSRYSAPGDLDALVDVAFGYRICCVAMILVE
jgi:hypothetical protein